MLIVFSISCVLITILALFKIVHVYKKKNEIKVLYNNYNDDDDDVPTERTPYSPQTLNGELYSNSNVQKSYIPYVPPAPQREKNADGKYKTLESLRYEDVDNFNKNNILDFYIDTSDFDKFE
jgi:hypothetical protein